MDYLDSLNSLGSVPGLDSIKELLRRLGNPEQKLRVIHIAGTNGKGSTGAFIDSILTAAGFKTGRYSSPAVFDPFEIIRLSGCNIDSDDFSGIITAVRTVCGDMCKEGLAHPTRFEVETAAALLFFAQEKVDYAIVECGMGGLLDATNVFERPECVVITPVSYDHMSFLGNSLTEIAHNKAGIIKNGCMVVSSNQHEEVMAVIEDKTNILSAKLTVADVNTVYNVDYPNRCFDYKEYKGLQTGLYGTYQIENAIMAIECVNTVADITENDIRTGLLNTEWNGRFEIIKGEPDVILDGAHNPAGAIALAESLNTYYPAGKLTFIVGVFADKDYKTVLEHTINHADKIVVTQTPENPRALSCEVLADFIKKTYDISVYTCKNIKDAVKLAYEVTAKDSAIVAFGSLSHLNLIKGELNGR